MNEKSQQLTRDELIEKLNLIFSGTLTDKQLSTYGKQIDENVPHPDVLALLYYPNSFRRRPAEEMIDIALAYEPPVIELPLLAQLWQLEGEVKQRFSRQGPLVDLAGIAWLTKELYWGGYGNSPLNSVAFASTGGDGGHYSFLLQNNRIDDTTPVIFTQPDMDLNAIVGESLYDCLCFGMHCGYFQPLDVLNESCDQSGHWLGRDVTSETAEILHWLAEELHLQPWPEHNARFQSLQDKYMPLLEIAEWED